jgi:DNA polymerase III delta prime subunit
MGIQLNDQQTAALNSMVEFCKGEAEWLGDGAGNMFCLEGYAGTGKSTTIQFLIRKLLDEGIAVACTAPTNKAAKVLASMAREQSIDVPCMTIHSMLGLRITQKEEDEELEKEGDGHIHKFKVIIVDEASMVNSSLYDFIATESTVYSVRVLFVGDPAQLPPVGETDSRVFGIENKARLTQIVRQAESNPIIGLSMEIRACIAEAEQGNTLMPATNKYLQLNGPSGITKLPSRDWWRWFPSAFQSDSFKQSNDAFRILAWTNKKVDEYNNAIHRLLYPNCFDTPFAEGEIVAFRKPLVQEGGTVLIATDQEVKVVGMLRADNIIYGDKMWQIEVETDEGNRHKVWYLDKADEVLFEQELKRLADLAKKEPDKEKRKTAWQDFWTLKKLPAQIAMCYAITVHRSQGSTFNNIFVDMEDIMRNRNWLECLKLFYVAITRARYAVVLS